MAGWSPDASQQRPKRRGSATVSFDDIHKAFTPEASKMDDGASGSSSPQEPAASESKDGATTTRLPSGTWYKVEQISFGENWELQILLKYH